MTHPTSRTDVDGAPTPRLRLAISGTFGVGKTTTAEAVAIAAGIPRTHALTSREILADLLPGKTVQELSGMELLLLGLRRLEERIHNEAEIPGSFVSDGSVIHEWIYGEARLRVGINPGAGPLLRATTTVLGLPYRRFYRDYMNAYGIIVKNRAQRLYDAFVHLPVEFAMERDGHRPVSEPFRQLSDQLLIDTLDELGIAYHVVGGTVAERIDQILALHHLPVIVPVDDAITLAHQRVREATTVLNAHARELAAHRSWRQRLRYALRY
jgi:hypothetical protein